jgi:hypothetical protein
MTEDVEEAGDFEEREAMAWDYRTSAGRTFGFVVRDGLVKNFRVAGPGPA